METSAAPIAPMIAAALPPPGVELVDGVWWTLDPYLEPVERRLSQLHDVCLIRNPGNEIFWSELGLGPTDSRFTVFLASHFQNPGDAIWGVAVAVHAQDL